MSSRLSNVELERRIRSLGLVPVVQLPDPALAVSLAETLAAAGLPCLEITFRAAGAAEAIAAIRGAQPEVLVGAGTVLTIGQADAALDAGAQFIVAPGTNPAVVEHVLGRGAPMIPGVTTPSEIESNLERGLQLLKFFPAEAAGGTAFLRAVLGPFPGVAFVPSGGISRGNLTDYLSLPNVVAVGGTWIAPTAALAARDFASIGRAAAEAVAQVLAQRASGA